MTISREQIEAMDECMEYSEQVTRETDQPDENYTAIPLIASVLWLAFIAFCAWIDAGFPTEFPL